MTNKKTDNEDNRKENYHVSRRRCEINGKRFSITRHFEGDRDLSTVMAEIAVSRADSEMG